MTHFSKFFNDLINSPKGSRLGRKVLFPLCLLSFFYGWVVSVRTFFYARGIFSTHSLPCKVVSVGNITLGGAGKTPFVCLLSEMIQSRGFRVAVLSRGYKGNFKDPFALVTDGERILMGAREAGDEPYLLAEKLRGVPVIVGRERWLSGKYAVERFQTEVVILDDGFQHLPLDRDLNLLLIDSASPFGNGYLFPRGSLREPLKALSRAEAVILTKVQECANIKNLKENLKKKLAECPIFEAEYTPGEVRVGGNLQAFPPDHLKGKKILAFSGLAKPESFQKTLLGLEARIVGVEAFPDHHWFVQKDVEELWQRGAKLNVDALVTTEKDMVRLKDCTMGPLPLLVLSIQHVFKGDDQPRFEEFIFSRLGPKR
jgi:tetraacyldisaccharide 4'-kinase